MSRHELHWSEQNVLLYNSMAEVPSGLSAHENLARCAAIRQEMTAIAIKGRTSDRAAAVAAKPAATTAGNISRQTVASIAATPAAPQTSAPVVATPASPSRVSEIKTPAQYMEDVERLAAVPIVRRIVGNWDSSLLTPLERWERLPEESRRVLRNYQSAGGGQYVPPSANT